MGLEIGSCKNDSNLPMVDAFFSFENLCFILPHQYTQKKKDEVSWKTFL